MPIGKIEGHRVFCLDDESIFVDVPNDFYVRNPDCNLAGYLVRYKGGYLAWSPKAPFEDGYVEIGDEVRQ
jgi:hypothetical protein